ncbi:OmpA family protein [Bacteroidota bacterium]
MRVFINILIIIIISLHQVAGQSTNITTLFMSNYRQADIYFHKMYYKNAIELYERVLEKDSSNIHSRVRIADCYRLIKDTENAEKWYGSVINERIDTINYYYYAQALSSSKKYGEARLWYSVYSHLAPDDSRAESKVTFMDQMEYYMRDSTLFELTHLPINSEHSDFGAEYYDSGFVFLSARDASLFIKNQPSTAIESDESMLDLFYTRYDSIGNLTEPDHFHKKLNSPYHEGSLVFFNGNRKIIFTRNNYHEGKAGRSSDERIKVMLVTAELDNEHNLKKLTPFPYNDPEYSIGHPSLSKDNNILYFSSDMPGGFGGNDIYMCYLGNNKWGTPINLGPSINSAGDEMFPFLADENTLYFASDGWGGFGGLDIFRAEGSGNRFGNTENLGFPLNSHKDDFSLVINEGGRSGYVSSDRPGGTGNDDIYTYEAKYFQIAGTVRELYYEDPIEEAEVTLLNEQGYPVDFRATDEKGHFHFDVPFDETFSFTASTPGHTLQDEIHYMTYDKKIGRDSITIYLWKHELFAVGTLFDHDTEETMPDINIRIHNLTDQTYDSTITDPSGHYKFLLRRNKEYDITVTKEGYLPDSVHINTFTITDGDILNDLVLEQKFLEKVFAFFNFDKSAVKPEYFASLDIIVDALRSHPNTFVLIGAHADARGSIEYNQALSERRAESTKVYIMARGVDESKIVTRGFGELLHINRCVDGVNCHEEEHQKNRRAEIKVEYNGHEAVKEFLEIEVEQE